MTFTTDKWHLRYTQQAQWTSQIRQFIFDRISLRSAKSILDIGCGTGVLEKEISGDHSSLLTGLDIDFPSLIYASKQATAGWVCADAFQLPFRDNSFDVILCHYLLLWLTDPTLALLEMRRVTQNCGFILILAEPDYTHRIDFPDELSILGKLQSDSLKEQGAHPGIGASIGGLLASSGFEVMEVGLSGGQWTPQVDEEEDELEWQVLLHDLPHSDLKKYKKIDRSARRNGSRILFVPVFYAIAQKTSK